MNGRKQHRSHLSEGVVRSFVEVSVVESMNSGTDIVMLFDKAHQQEQTTHFRRVKAITRAIIFLAAHELALRGTEDSGKLASEVPEVNDGLLRSKLLDQINHGDLDAELVLSCNS